MPNSPLLSTYRAGENRVTSSMMAVFQRLELSLFERLLGAVTEDSALQLVAFVNQPPGISESVPDARISANFDFWFETKTTPNALSAKQMFEHFKNLTEGGVNERLFIVTPDPERPEILENLHDKRVIWFNFRALSYAIDEILDDKKTFVSEQTRFLFRELQQLFDADGLLDSTDTVVVAARFAWDEFNKYGVYVCQPNRSFRPGITHMGFYTLGEIKPTIAKILDQSYEALTFDAQTVETLITGTEMDKRIAAAIRELLSQGIRTEGQPYRVFVLSRNEDEGSVELKGPIVNTTKAASGRAWAWTLAQRYTSLSSLIAPGVATTGDLESAGG